MTEIRILREDVQKTKTFKSLNPILKKITSSRNNIAQISHAVNVCKNIGYKKWEKQTNANWRTQEIVKELLKNQKCQKN